ncbi:neuronal growth regulator 1 [Plakobranchus ocellatus]|uniref:Neuronal growth regulator 1 n=1 Tax=Plakobranchus ocellatus TaxID=259542 RepID=A0AAV4AWZ6_9GAST|nr:neuronal growth regulator 1 [Plakobranchus ocellatus]
MTRRVPPQIISSSQFLLKLNKGSNHTLFCRGEGSPKPTVSWKKDGRPLNDTSSTRVVGDKVQLFNLGRQDGGIYACQFENSVGFISQPIKVIVEGE